MIDPVHGGMRGAPKFPQPMMLEFLWRAGQRMNDERYFGAVELHARADVRGRHLRPPRRRLLALLGRRALAGAAFREDALRQRPAAGVSGVAFQRSGNALFRTRADETVAWLTREMTTGRARSRIARRRFRGRRGQILRLVARRDRGGAGRRADAAFFAAHYDVTSGRQFRGHNILNRLKHLPRSMEDERGSPDARKTARRARRPGPAGPRRQGAGRLERLMIAALVNAGLAFGRPRWIELPARAFHFVAPG